MQSSHQFSQGQLQMPYQQQITTPNMPPPTQQQQQQQQQQQPQPGRYQGQANGSAVPPDVLSKSQDGKKYKLEVVQEPVRARMCGFGDKDRRPITPPPCVRLVIIDEKSGRECEPGEFEVNFFILTVDLWDETGHKEVNLVRHSATSPSISAATSSSYPPPTTPVYAYSANTAAAANAHSQAAAQHAPGMQVHVGMTSPGYGPAQFAAHHTAPYMAQPPQHPSQQPGHPGAGSMNPYAPQQDPMHPASRGGGGGGEAQSYYVSPTGQPTGAAMTYQQQQQQQHAAAAAAAGYGVPAGYPGANMALLSPAHATPMDPRSAPSGMFTRNLIGSLAVNGNTLTDPAGKPGIWFILQDLSVRTEGVFRLKMQFCSVANPDMKNTLLRGNAPILASTFSAPFQVYSAKKFPGVIESTPLSKCFAMQGVKIPIRKDGPTGKAAEVDDETNE